MTTYRVFHILTPKKLSTEAFAELLSIIDNDGIEELNDSIKVYVSENEKEEFESALTVFLHDFQTTYTVESLEEKNWNEEWEKNFQPLRINDFVGIRSDFHPKFENVKYEIIINPKMSFGTGHHATTQQMMQMMALIEIQEKKVLDCGSGTGVLAILAHKMNAREIIAFDNDTWSYENHLENVALNQAQTEMRLGSLEEIVESDFNVILANIHKNFIAENMSLLSSKLKDNGFLIVSGFLSTDNQDILNTAQENQLLANYITQSENWSCILLQKTKEK
ncbi:MAG: 50S ribosomal protein L11 methyltransferase [Chitinophagales bacterium]|nr:50S ribosomal protein L11 methyltransferase [Chitinophagales bacterium]